MDTPPWPILRIGPIMIPRLIFPALTLVSKMTITFSRKLEFVHRLMHWKVCSTKFPMVYWCRIPKRIGLYNMKDDGNVQNNLKIAKIINSWILENKEWWDLSICITAGWNKPFLKLSWIERSRKKGIQGICSCLQLYRFKK